MEQGCRFVGMKATELRVGNFISLSNGVFDGLVIVVGWPEIKQIELSIGNGYSPIPLTEDWLKRLPSSQLEKLSEFGFTRLYKIGRPDKIVGYGFYVATNLVEIKSIHKLQNTYFEFTSEELNVKPSDNN